MSARSNQRQTNKVYANLIKFMKKAFYIPNQSTRFSSFDVQF